jgi:hypothetical protein
MCYSPRAVLMFVFFAFQNTLPFESQLVLVSCPRACNTEKLENSIRRSRNAAECPHSTPSLQHMSTLVLCGWNARFVHHVGTDIVLP